jgi:hypothetical protein
MVEDVTAEERGSMDGGGPERKDIEGYECFVGECAHTAHTLARLKGHLFSAHTVQDREAHRGLFQERGLRLCDQPCGKVWVVNASGVHANHKCPAVQRKREIEAKFEATAKGDQDGGGARDAPPLVNFDAKAGERGTYKNPFRQPSVVDPFVLIPSHTDPKLISLLKLIFQRSRRLSKVLPSKQWQQPMTDAWLRATAAIAPELKAALDINALDESNPALLNVVMRLAELPQAVLLPFLPEPKGGGADLNHPDAAGTEAGGDRDIRRIEALGNLDLVGKATQQLLSNGIMEGTKEVVDVIEAMHPKLKQDLDLTELEECRRSTPQARVSTKEAKSFLFKAAATDHTSIGFFGWSANLLFPLRGVSGGGAFINQLARLIATIAQGEVHDVFGFALSCGSIFALNKISKQAQSDRMAKGLPPKLRPVNVGCAFLKWAFKLALKTPEAELAIAALSPIQMGLKAKHGVAAVVHLMRAVREKGYSISLTDFQNGFNAFARQKMLEAVKKRCPALMGVFLKFYALRSMCLMREKGSKDGWRVIWSVEGSRMGCCFGSFGFDLTVQDLYEFIANKYPDAVVKALTDDLTIAFPPLAKSTDAKSGEAKRVEAKDGDPPSSELVVDVDNVAACFEDITREAAKIGLIVVPSKSGVVPGRGARVDDDAFPGIEVKREGARLAGGPIGTDDYCEAFMCDLVDDIGDRLEAVKRLSDSCPQVGFKILCNSLNHALTFALQVTPPLVSLPAAERFDKHKFEAAEALITPSCMPKPPQCSEARMKRARHKLSMPASLKGAGLTSAVTIAPGAWYASVAAASFHDADLATHAPALARFGQHAHRLIVERIGDAPSEASKGIEGYFDRSNENSLVGSSFYRDIFINNPNVKLQKKFSRAAHLLAHDKHLNTLAEAALSPPLARAHDVDESDVVAGFTKSQFSSVFYAQLKYPRNRMSPFRFATWVRFFVKLPQPPHLHAGNLQPRKELAYDAEECLGHHAKGVDALLDLHANHACGRCVSSYAGMGERHSNIKWCIHSFSKEAGLQSKVEPNTHNLLNRDGVEYTREQVASMFPKGSTSKQKALSAELQSCHARLSSTDGTLPRKERDELDKRSQTLTKALAQMDKNRGTLRIDLELFDPITGQVRWVDTTSSQTTCKSHIKGEMKGIKSLEAFQAALKVSERAELEAMERGEEEKKGAHREQKERKNRKQNKNEKERRRDAGVPAGHTVTKQEKFKMVTYAPLVRIATEQHEKGKRLALPVFHPFVVTTLGEEGPLAVSLREWIVMAYRAKLEREGPRNDGQRLQDMTADFRTRFRSSIHIAVAKGLARMISSAGFPTTSCAKYTG